MIRYTFISCIILLSLVLAPHAGIAASSTQADELALEGWLSDQLTRLAEDSSEPALVVQRLAYETVTLMRDVTQFNDLEQPSSWLGALRAAWEERGIRVQLRQVRLLLLSAERQELVRPEIQDMVEDYLEQVSEQVGD